MIHFYIAGPPTAVALSLCLGADVSPAVGTMHDTSCTPAQDSTGCALVQTVLSDVSCDQGCISSQGLDEEAEQAGRWAGRQT